MGNILSKSGEFFTVVATGECAISIRGLSRLSGIPKTTLTKWFESDLSASAVPQDLRRLALKDNPVTRIGLDKASNPLPSKDNLVTQELYLGQEILVRNNPIKAVRSSVAAQVIQYAAFELGKDASKEALKSFVAIGLDSYIQGETGYLPTLYTESTLDPRNQITRLVQEANPWKRLYTKRVCDKIRKWYFPRDFFWVFCYSWMTEEETAFLNEHNPVIEGVWQRKDRIFQFLSEETRERLEPEISALCTLVESSTGKSDFETRWRRVHGKDQVELNLISLSEVRHA